MHVGDNVGENNINGFQVNHFENNGHSILPIFKMGTKQYKLYLELIGFVKVNNFLKVENVYSTFNKLKCVFRRCPKTL